MNEEEKNNSENTELVETEQNDSYVPAEQESADESFKNDSFYKIAKGKGIFNLPNKLTISRMVMIPVFILFFYLDFVGHFFVALAVFIVASLTDLLDGKIARKYHLVTNLGKFLDPIADKVLVSTAFILMLPASWIFSIFTDSWMVIVGACGVAIILAREIIISGFRMVAADAGIVIAADIFGKYKTVFQDASIIVLLISAGVIEICISSGSSALLEVARAVNYIGLIIFAAAVILTIISGVNYIVKNIGILKK